MSIVYGQRALNTFYELHIQTTQIESEYLETGLDTILESVYHILQNFLSSHFNCLKFYLVCEAEMQVFKLFYI